ncbi:MAG: hypothetical protein ABIO18_05670, partial [Croceibacterium sp.]
MFERGEMHRTGITPNPRNDSRTPVMLATRIPDGIRPSPLNETRAAWLTLRLYSDTPLAIQKWGRATSTNPQYHPEFTR